MDHSFHTRYHKDHTYVLRNSFGHTDSKSLFVKSRQSHGGARELFLIQKICDQNQTKVSKIVKTIKNVQVRHCSNSLY